MLQDAEESVHRNRIDSYQLFETKAFYENEILFNGMQHSILFKFSCEFMTHVNETIKFSKLPFQKLNIALSCC